MQFGLLVSLLCQLCRDVCSAIKEVVLCCCFAWQAPGCLLALLVVVVRVPSLAVGDHHHRCGRVLRPRLRSWHARLHVQQCRTDTRRGFIELLWLTNKSVCHPPPCCAQSMLPLTSECLPVRSTLLVLLPRTHMRCFPRLAILLFCLLTWTTRLPCGTNKPWGLTSVSRGELHVCAIVFILSSTCFVVCPYAFFMSTVAMAKPLAALERCPPLCVHGCDLMVRCASVCASAPSNTLSNISQSPVALNLYQPRLVLNGPFIKGATVAAVQNWTISRGATARTTVSWVLTLLDVCESFATEILVQCCSFARSFLWVFEVANIDSGVDRGFLVSR